ncbi:MAG TPA: hypothetical protein VKS21_10515 [Spirochaetota bacterium]|nr:hypothetical protein [Spirochaetota bacterium]
MTNSDKKNKDNSFTEKAADLLLKAASKKNMPRIKPVKEAQKQLKLDSDKLNNIARKFEANKKAVYKLMLLTLKKRKMKKQGVKSNDPQK